MHGDWRQNQTYKTDDDDVKKNVEAARSLAWNTLTSLTRMNTFSASKIRFVMWLFFSSQKLIHQVRKWKRVPVVIFTSLIIPSLWSAHILCIKFLFWSFLHLSSWVFTIATTSFIGSWAKLCSSRVILGSHLKNLLLNDWLKILIYKKEVNMQFPLIPLWVLIGILTLLS